MKFCRKTKMSAFLTVLLFLLGSLAVWTPAQAQRSGGLGPADGRDLDSADLDRVQVGDLAPDFSLRAYSGDVVTLSDFRGKKNVVLVFYRGYW